MGTTKQSLQPLNTMPVTDQFNRPIKDLRISLTDRCQFRCQYCLPAEHESVMRQQSGRKTQLDFAQILQAVQAFAQLGVSKIRLTGGEPLLRKNIPDLVQKIKAVPGIQDVALTTNAALLAPLITPLVDAGLDRITISLDALDQHLFEQITGTQEAVADLLHTIELCAQSPIKKIKLNSVIQRGVNEDQIIPIIQKFKNTRVTPRFIEYMDVGNINGWQPDQVFAAQDILNTIGQQWSFEPLEPTQVGEVASRYGFSDGSGEFGLIASITQPFCGDCNRARLGANGHVYTCLFSDQGHDIKPLLNQPDALLPALKQIWQNRDDRYSQLRFAQPKQKKIEMFVMGG